MTADIPYAMRSLPRDRRGFAVPYVVMLDNNGNPHFTINDDRKLYEVRVKKLCALCGKPHKLGALWFIGGAGSAFHEHGTYIDAPVHEACGRYAIQVCPYLAAPNYGKRIDGKTVRPGDFDHTLITLDRTMDPDRPPVFTFCRASGYKYVEGYFLPRRPWKHVEFWQQGVQIDEATAAKLQRESKYAPETLKWWPR